MLCQKLSTLLPPVIFVALRAIFRHVAFKAIILGSFLCYLMVALRTVALRAMHNKVAGWAIFCLPPMMFSDLDIIE